MARRFEGKVVAITGAAGGIGAALCAAFAREGASIALLDIDANALQTAHDKVISLGARATSVTVDVTNELNCTTAIDQVCEEFDGIDVLINNAGITHFSLCERTNPNVFRRVMDVNYFGAVHCTQAALQSLIMRRGAIGVVSSIAGFAPLIARAGYCASKHALHGYFETLRCEVRRHDVSVTMICPGFTQSGLERRALAADGSISRSGRSQVGEQAFPEEVAQAVVNAIYRRRRIAILSKVGRLTWLIRRCAPPLYDRMMTRRLRSEFDREP